MVEDINSGLAGANPHDLININGTLFFGATDGIHGNELWRSNGTPAGTVLVRDINPGPGDSTPTDFADVSGTLFFVANDGAHGAELWKSNGTAAGTALVDDIAPGKLPSNPRDLANVNGTLFFRANDGIRGHELWRSNGTAAGTVLVKDINPGSASSHIRYTTNVNGTLFFAANDGTHGNELWTSNGTAAGTFLVRDINPGHGAYNGSYPKYLTNINGTLFFEADDVVHGGEPWVLDPAHSSAQFVPSPGDRTAAGQASAAPASVLGAIRMSQVGKSDGVSGALSAKMPARLAVGGFARRADGGSIAATAMEVPAAGRNGTHRHGPIAAIDDLMRVLEWDDGLQ
jgi:ELWxxDGT repeat protein